jgi:hypothetical protein
MGPETIRLTDHSNDPYGRFKWIVTMSPDDPAT